MLPITNEQAKAIQATSEFGTTSVKEVGQLATYLGKILGTIPEDAVGLVIGDPLHIVRTYIAAKLDGIITNKLRDRHVKETQPVSPSLAIPLLRAAYDESRPELQELWAGLIAAAMDPSRAFRVRQSFIDTLKRFDPFDALVLQELNIAQGQLSPTARDFLASKLKVNIVEIALSASNLAKLECIDVHPQGEDFRYFAISIYGRALIQACLD